MCLYKGNSRQFVIFHFIVMFLIMLLSFSQLHYTVKAFSGSEFSDTDANSVLWMKHLSKQLTFPEGFIISFTSGVEIPLLKAIGEALTSKLKIQLPFEFDLGKLPMVSFRRRKSENFALMNPWFGSENNKSRIIKREVFKNETGDGDCSTGQRQRIKVLKKLESTLDSIGMSGEACLLRAICELHELDAVDAFGLLAEIAKLLISIKDKNGNCRHKFVMAEENGRKHRCTEYVSGCSKSLFRWKVNYIPHFYKQSYVSRIM